MNEGIFQIYLAFLLLHLFLNGWRNFKYIQYKSTFVNVLV